MADRTPAEREAWIRDAVCDLARPINDGYFGEHLTAYRAAVREERDAELREQVERVTRYQRSRMGMDKDDEIGSWLFRADVLALFAVDAARSSERAP